ncbi:MAG: hypothetical protein JWM03_565 [Rhodocyclales bacterium]|nr:hypothetical protein [Rhodocyclales bacterium]
MIFCLLKTGNEKQDLSFTTEAQRIAEGHRGRRASVALCVSVPLW